MAIDFREMRDSLTPDKMGNIIPYNLESGQIAWSASGSEPKTLSARSEQISLDEGLASTYSCANCCPNVITDVHVHPEDLEVEYGDITPFFGTQFETNCYNQYLGPYSSQSVDWESQNTGIATIDLSGESEAVGVGYTTIHGCITRTIWYNWGGGHCEPVEDMICNIAPIEVRPKVSIDDFKAVGKNQTAVIKVTVSGNPNNENITLTLSANAGTGVANFTSNNSNTLNITSTTNVEIKGITESSTKDNMRIRATYNYNGNNRQLATKSFTVISVELSARLTGQVSSDNSARQIYQLALGTLDLGGPFLSPPAAGTQWRIGIEIKATILPANFSHNIKLKREIVTILNHTRVNSAGTFTTDTNCNQHPSPPCEDTSLPEWRDDVPSMIYDLDAPGQYFSSAAQIGRILRSRRNFTQWATVSQKNGGSFVEDVRVSANINWFFRLSIHKTASGTIEVLSDVANDNMIGLGTTPLGADL